MGLPILEIFDFLFEICGSISCYSCYNDSSLFRLFVIIVVVLSILQCRACIEETLSVWIEETLARGGFVCVSHKILKKKLYVFLQTLSLKRKDFQKKYFPKGPRGVT